MAPLNDDCWPLKNISVLSNRGCNSRTYTEGIIHYYKNLVAASYYDIRLWREVAASYWCELQRPSFIGCVYLEKG